MADQTGLRGKLLRGARQIARVLYPGLYDDDDPESEASRAAIRKLYVEWHRYPVFQLGDNTELLALEDRLLSFLEARSMAAEVAAELLAASEQKAAPPAAKTALTPKPKARPRRRARYPANEAA